MHSVMCLAHMGQKDYKTYDENDPKHDIDMCALAEQQAKERKAAKAVAVNQITATSDEKNFDAFL